MNNKDKEPEKLHGFNHDDAIKMKQRKEGGKCDNRTSTAIARKIRKSK